jgi:thiol-disulfide isomerase/thioredoxin
MTRMSLLALTLATAGMALTAGAQDKKADEVTLRVVKYDGLKEEVFKHRGKVVMIDFWGDFCLPCKKAFPHTVELHNKFKSQGLVVISVALDSLEGSGVKENCLKFLQKQKAAFTNLLLDETDEFWQRKFRMDGPPCFYVFSRKGEWTQLMGEDLEGPSMTLDRLIEDLLGEK